MNPRHFVSELRRRNVYKVAVAYAVVSWLLIQIATQVFPFFEIPNWAVRFVVLLLILGFPVALSLAWAFELTPEGIKRVEDVAPNESITRRTGRKLDFLIIGVLLVVIGFFTYQRYGPSRRTAVPTAPLLEKSIAVLPFENRSEEKANAYFADGIQDEILTRLSKIADLKVISRTSTQHYESAPQNLPEIARQLRVAHILEGSVQKSGDTVRVNVQLIKAATDSHLWADTFDRKLTDIFSVESEVAKAIAEQLQAKISPSENSAIEKAPTTDLVAFDLYTRAKTLLLNSFLDPRAADIHFQAVRLLDEAVARDPQFLLAWCLLSRVHGNIY